jgi:hypothetical protein
MAVGVAPIESATQAFSSTIALNNAGAMHMERGDYFSSIRALTCSFLSFKKIYGEQKPHLVSLRTLIQESSATPSSTTSTKSLEGMIFNVGELFSWSRSSSSCGSRRRRDTKMASGEVASSTLSSETSSSRDCSVNCNNDCSDFDHHPSFCHSYRSSANPAADTNQQVDVDCKIDDDSVNATTGAVDVDAAAIKATSHVSVTEEDEDEEDWYNYQDVASVYSNPIRLPPDFPITKESCGFLSSAITLNLALANHLFGLELLQRQQYSATPSSVFLSSSSSMIYHHLMKANRYYEYTIRLERARQQEERGRMAATAAAVSFSQSPFPPTLSSLLLPPLFVSPLALLVVLNNLGQLHLVLSNKDRSQRFYRQLQSTLMFLLLHSSQTANNSKDLAVFMENATLGLQNSSSRSMAAAA